jgi:deazaflavin-dependent oxidoreductase (nitroreductase family)
LNAVVRPLAKLGVTGPRTHLLTVRGRASGRLWSTPVSIVRVGEERWLVAPYGDRNWVRNARAAGWVELRRGRCRERLAVEELTPEHAVPVLQEYYRLGRVTHPFFAVSLESSPEEWLADAPLHPVFRLRPDRS